LFICALDTNPCDTTKEKISIKSSAIEIFSPKELNYHLAWRLSTIFGHDDNGKRIAISLKSRQKQYIASKYSSLPYIAACQDFFSVFYVRVVRLQLAPPILFFIDFISYLLTPRVKMVPEKVPSPAMTAVLVWFLPGERSYETQR
jgi:hypothetical protein